MQRVPVVVTQSRRGLAIGLAVGLVLLAWSLWAWPNISPTARIFAAIFGAFGIATVVGSVIGLVRPARLVLEPSGLTHESVFRSRRWSWSETGAFRVEDDEGSKSISFELGAKPQGLPAGWTAPPDEVCALLNEARARWS